jgi:hypothetical protein
VSFGGIDASGEDRMWSAEQAQNILDCVYNSTWTSMPMTVS